MWLKVILHTGSLSEKREREEGGAGRKGQDRTVRIAEEGEGQPGGQAAHSTVQSSLFASDMIGEVWKDTWGYRRSKNAEGINSEQCSTSDPRLTSTNMTSMEDSIPPTSFWLFLSLSSQGMKMKKGCCFVFF